MSKSKLKGLLTLRFRILRMTEANEELLKIMVTDERKAYYEAELEFLHQAYRDCMIKLKIEYDHRSVQHPSWYITDNLRQELEQMPSAQDKEAITTEPNLPIL